MHETALAGRDFPHRDSSKWRWPSANSRCPVPCREGTLPMMSASTSGGLDFSQHSKEYQVFLTTLTLVLPEYLEPR